VSAQAWIAAIVGVAAIADDLSRRQISNWISGSAFVAGLVLQTVEGGWRGAGSAVLGTLTGAGVFLIFYLLGGMGGGDIKLMAGFGAVLGVKRLLEAALWTAGCGGLLALAVISFRTILELSRKKTTDSAGVEVPQGAQRADSIPYAPAIAAGVWLTLVATA
jgi:prepilin peptidase CpaA